MPQEASPADMLPARAVIEEAIRVVAAPESRVRAAYLFGSVASGAAGPLSDIDVGVLISGDANERAEVAAHLMDSLCRRLRTQRVDVVSLVDASMPLRYRVVRDGALVLNRDAAAQERFVVESVLHYLDFKPLRDRAFGLLRRAILERA